jgi:hypothetical protein
MTNNKFAALGTDGTRRKTYTYTIFDSNPHSSSGAAWPSHEYIEIEAESDAEALDAVRDVMRVEAAGLDASDYDVRQRLYARVWDSRIVGEPTYQLTAEDLGLESDDDLVTLDDADGLY